MKPIWVYESAPDYKGRRVHGSPGVQEAAVELLVCHAPARGAALDLGSGSGTMLLRLSEVGFEELDAVARIPGVFGELGEMPSDSGAAYHQLDLNEDFAGRFSRRFDVVVSSEVIEHLHSPRRFIEQAALLLEPGGFLLLTTPNFANWIGRLRFLILGELRWFDAQLAPRLGHISPITDTQMRMLLADANLELVGTTCAGSYSRPLRTLVSAIVALPFLLFFGRRAWGDCNVYLARKSG